jgi:hypothetical protein
MYNELGRLDGELFGPGYVAPFLSMPQPQPQPQQQQQQQQQQPVSAPLQQSFDINTSAMSTMNQSHTTLSTSANTSMI